MRLGKIEKEVLVTLLDETQGRDFEDGLNARSLINRVAIRLGKWDEMRVNSRCYWRVKGLDGQDSFRASLSRAFNRLEHKELVVKTRYRRLTDRGRLVARGIKISRAKIKR